jgi:hypothetical protein
MGFYTNKHDITFFGSSYVMGDPTIQVKMRVVPPALIQLPYYQQPGVKSQWTKAG